MSGNSLSKSTDANTLALLLSILELLNAGLECNVAIYALETVAVARILVFRRTAATLIHGGDPDLPSNLILVRPH